MSGVKLEGKRSEYSERTFYLMAVIGECYLGLDTPDQNYFKNKLCKAIKELNELNKQEEED